MPFADSTQDEATLEECLDELGEFVSRLERYAPTLLAVALRVHLAALLQVLLESSTCRGEEVREFIRELERDALQYQNG